MVRVFYEPPPYGPKTCLNRTGYGLTGGGLFGTALERVSKMKSGPIMAVATLSICALSYLPLRKLVALVFDWHDLFSFSYNRFDLYSFTTTVGGKPLPFSMEPEYQVSFFSGSTFTWVCTEVDEAHRVLNFFLLQTCAIIT